jgi:hypothetical protein
MTTRFRGFSRTTQKRIGLSECGEVHCSVPGIQVLESTHEVLAERSGDVIPNMVSKLPRWSNVTSQQLGQIGDSMMAAE